MSAAAPPQPTPDVSVIVLSYNSAAFMAGCLHSLSRTRGVAFEVICVDNASADRSHELAKSNPATTKAILSETNLGFGGGNDLGWREARAPVLVFVNPDCYVSHDTLARMLETLRSDPNIGIVGAKLLYPGTTTIQHAGGILHPNAMAEHHGMGEPDGPKWNEPRDVDYVTGALFAIRREDVERLGGFDRDYFPAYYEETDWCARLRREGRTIRYEPRAVAWHHESAGLGKQSPRFVWLMYRNRIRFVVKNFTIGELFAKFLPFEVNWFFGPFAKGFRWVTVMSWVAGAGFAVKCVARMSRRHGSVGHGSAGLLSGKHAQSEPRAE